MRFMRFACTSAILLAAVIHTPSATADDDHKNENAGPPPNCPYGYFDYSPYDCAPYGYYGHEWFHDGVFIGAGPWFQGPDHFSGQVDDHFNPHYGYKGELPRRGEKRDNQHPLDKIKEFRPTEERDGKGNQYREHSH